MITVNYRTPKSYDVFNRVFCEAEDDGNENNSTVKKTTVKKPKGKVITPDEPDNTTDYTQDVEEDNPPNNEQQNNDNTEANEPDETVDQDDATDYTQDTDEVDDQSEQEQPEEGDDEATDYTQDAEGDEGDDSQGTVDTTSSETEEPQDDSTPQQRYDIYKSILDLHEHVTIYINKLGDLATFNKDANLVVTTVTNKLKTLSEKIHDYLTISFSGSTYLQSVYFFQNSIAIVKELINLLHNNAIFLKGSTN